MLKSNDKNLSLLKREVKKKMKKVGLMLTSVMMGLLLVSGSAMALGIDISAIVNPNYEDSWVEDTLSGRALYNIWVDMDSLYGANVFSVTFENDIFASLGMAGLIAPPGWSLILATNPINSNQYQIALGGLDLLMPGEVPCLSFWVDYTLRSANRYFNTSGPGWAWDEGGRWEQAVSATNTLETLPSYLGGGNPSGGTSTAPVPEPSSMILLGMGLVGLFGLKKRFQTK